MKRNQTSRVSPVLPLYPRVLLDCSTHNFHFFPFPHFSIVLSADEVVLMLRAAVLVFDEGNNLFKHYKLIPRKNDKY